MTVVHEKLERKHVSRLVPGNPKHLVMFMLGVAVVNEMTMGYDSSMMNGLNILPQYSDYFNLNTVTTGLNTSATWLGGILSCFVLQPIPDRLGRKNGILIGCIVTLIGAIIQSAAQNIATFVIGRIFIGIGTGINTGSAPTLIGEVLPAESRGPIMGIFFSCYYVGSLLSSGINYRVVDVQSTWAWRIPSIIQAFPSLLAIACLPFMPESPRWLVSQGRTEEARETLAIIYGQTDVNSVEAEKVYSEVVHVLKREAELYPKNPWIELVSSKPNLRRLWVVASFGVMIELCGNFVISFYLGDMLDQAGITDSTTQLQINIILNCWCFVVAIVGSYTLDILGRRLQTLICFGGMIITLFLFGGLSKAYGTSTNTSGIYGTIAVVFLFQGFYSFSITPLTSLYPPEILNYKTRTAGVAVFRFLDDGFGMMASFCMSFAMDNLGYKFYFINAAWDIVFALIVYFYWPETARVPLEEVALHFGDIHDEDIFGEVEGVEQVPMEAGEKGTKA
ncbi:general substrate transporter [Xylariales sp. PMI_506]|nr:general substrate transporter [Xylariales sp. PMI_506]